ncbi:fatty-acid--CoA ligase [Pigmentiphaga aceris]|uniref:Fatty-acid--CoA ligase n=1 Tax=Pigmentiphaga aceris TaxID=1940612 RepID=A0A5C0AYZ6_9BURK|nr:3-(methylthio)propionyl-CoA ligase [Pigmentiphaga aceris]QEI06814.1 fatty-acid--CoA ligase [Pigmentiphaga aceris]
MRGLMMQTPLLISDLIQHAARFHGDTEIVSRRVEGDIHRTNYRDLHTRIRKLANALTALGVKPGDRVGTLAWNGYRHMELYYAVSGMGAILHTINPRLLPDQIAWIINHAEDSFLFYDANLQPIVEQIAGKTPGLQGYVLMADADRLPAESAAAPLLAYESLVDAASDEFTWPSFDENTASSLCYTSGTTGNPKGVLYSHRSTVLHAYAAALPDVMNLSATDVILPVVPMFHVNAWGLPYAAPLVGCKIVFPGPALDGKSLHDLFEAEGVTMSAGVPTVWQGLLAYVDANGLAFSTMRRTVIGGSACPPAMMRAFEEKYRVTVVHAWGMSETSPLGTSGALKSKHSSLSAEARYAVKFKQGLALPSVDLKIVDDEGNELPWDGKTFGNLMTRGPWIVNEYYGEDKSALQDGWFQTGDVAVIDPDGYMQITDRSKDVIKSGGEWISSIELENIAVSHPGVQIAACFGVAHPRWDERPLLVVVRKPDSTLDREEMLAFFDGKIAKWQKPDDVVFVDSIPLGATGKMLKAELRRQFAGYRLPGVDPA